MNKKYRKWGAPHSLGKVVEFESDAITLDIPKEGVTVKDWEITPLMPPVVSF